MGNTTPPRLTHTATQFAQRISCVNSVKMPEAGSRLYVKGRHISYQRAKRNTNPNTSLLQLEGVSTTEAANFYLGKKVAYVSRAHGNSGVVRAQFRHNLPPKSFGASVRVMLYP